MRRILIVIVAVILVGCATTTVIQKMTTEEVNQHLVKIEVRRAECTQMFNARVQAFTYLNQALQQPDKKIQQAAYHKAEAMTNAQRAQMEAYVGTEDETGVEATCLKGINGDLEGLLEMYPKIFARSI